MKLEITKEKVLKASKRCEQAKEVLKDMFPEAFEEKLEWIDVTRKLRTDYSIAYPNNFGFYDAENNLVFWGEIKIIDTGEKFDAKIEGACIWARKKD